MIKPASDPGEILGHASGEKALEKLGACLSPLLGQQLLITLAGELGAGKTTLVRGLLRGAGFSGPVKSPTFSLVEPYDLQQGKVFHFDLYRLTQPEELEFIGIREYLSATGLCIVEWPEKAADILPDADIHIMISRTEPGRDVVLKALTGRGEKLIQDASINRCWSALQAEALA